MAKDITVVSGGAGFIGANLVPKLLEEGLHVVVLDNFSRGRAKYLEPLRVSTSGQLTIEHIDLSNISDTYSLFAELSEVGNIREIWHLAANSDIPAGIEDSNIDLKDTFLTTHSLLSAAQKSGVPRFHFASSSAVYGDHGEAILSENTGPLKPISNYGAMKLASEAALTAAQESFLEVANIFRFPNVIGIPATHGVILDFINKLNDTPDDLTVLGNGQQKKCYLHVSDLVAGLLFIRSKCVSGSNIFNVGPIDDGITVSKIAEEVVRHVNPSANIHYGDDTKGWVGDVPKFRYNVDSLKNLGWVPELDSRNAINVAIQEILKQRSD